MEKQKQTDSMKYSLNTWSTFTENTFDLLQKMLTMDPKERINTATAMDHPYFKVNLKSNCSTLGFASR